MHTNVGVLYTLFKPIFLVIYSFFSHTYTCITDTLPVHLKQNEWEREKDVFAFGLFTFLAFNSLLYVSLTTYLHPHPYTLLTLIFLSFTLTRLLTYSLSLFSTRYNNICYLLLCLQAWTIFSRGCDYLFSFFLSLSLSHLFASLPLPVSLAFFLFFTDDHNDDDI